MRCVSTYSALSAGFVFLCAAAISVMLLTGVPQYTCAQSPSLDKKITDQQKTLDRIREQIKEHRARSKKLGRREKAVLGNLQRIDREIDLSREFLRNLAIQESLLSEHIDSLRAEIRENGDEVDVQQARLASRLRAMYMRDPHYRLDFILGASTMEQVVTRYRYSRLIAQQDAALVRSFRERTLQLETESARMTEMLADMSVVRNERESEAEKLEVSKKKRKETLRKIRTQKSQHGKAIVELKKAQARVKNLIGGLEKKRMSEKGGGPMTAREFAALKGKMRWPVKGRVVRPFGKFTHPKYGTVTFNNGVDIEAAPGTPILAVAAGTVEFVDWIEAYGKCIIINHGAGYYTLYAHVSTTFVRQHQLVGGGDVIAEVGDTGSLDGYQCHFEIRKSKRALNPMHWFARSTARSASR